MNHMDFPFLCVYLSLASSKDELHLGIKNERVHFILLSVCIIFATPYKNKRVQ